MSYNGRCIGRIIDILQEYDFHVGENCTIGENTISMYGKEIANYLFYKSTDIPVFKFFGEYECLNEIQDQKQIETVKYFIGYPIFDCDHSSDNNYLGNFKYNVPFRKDECIDAYINHNQMRFHLVNNKETITSNFFSPINFPIEQQLKDLALFLLGNKSVTYEDAKHWNNC